MPTSWIAIFLVAAYCLLSTGVLGVHLGLFPSTRPETRTRFSDMLALLVFGTLLDGLALWFFLLDWKWLHGLFRIPLLFQCGVLFSLGWLMMTGLRQMKGMGSFSHYAWKFPPAWTTGMVGGWFLLFSGALWFQVPASDTFPFMFRASAFSLPFAMAFRFIEKKTPSPFFGNETATKRLGTMTDDALLEWIQNESATTQDLFDSTVHSDPIASRMIGQETMGRIGLVGENGIGKTTILKMVEDRIFDHNRKHPEEEILVCPIDGWARANGTLADCILEQILSALATRVDVLSLLRLPKHYAAAMSATGNRAFRIGALLLGETRNTERLLSGLETLLETCNLKVVLVIEDLDRNTDEKPIREELPGVLSRLRKIHRVGFVLAIEKRVAYSEILLRLCDTQKEITIDDDAKQRVVSRLYDIHRNRAREQGVVLPSDLLKEVFHVPSDPEGPAFDLEERLAPISSERIANAIATPRILKAVFRDVHAAWERNMGEIELDDLVSIMVLKYAFPEAFHLLIEQGIDLWHRLDDAMDKSLGETAFAPETDTWKTVMEKAAPSHPLAVRAWSQLLETREVSWKPMARYAMQLVRDLSIPTALSPQKIDLGRNNGYLEKVRRSPDVVFQSDQRAIGLVLEWREMGRDGVSRDWLKRCSRYLQNEPERLHWISRFFSFHEKNDFTLSIVRSVAAHCWYEDEDSIPLLSLFAEYLCPMFREKTPSRVACSILHFDTSTSTLDGIPILKWAMQFKPTTPTELWKNRHDQLGQAIRSGLFPYSESFVPPRLVADWVALYALQDKGVSFVDAAVELASSFGRGPTMSKEEAVQFLFLFTQSSASPFLSEKRLHPELLSRFKADRNPRERTRNLLACLFSHTLEIPEMHGTDKDHWHEILAWWKTEGPALLAHHFPETELSANT